MDLCVLSMRYKILYLHFCCSFFLLNTISSHLLYDFFGVLSCENEMVSFWISMKCDMNPVMHIHNLPASDNNFFFFFTAKSQRHVALLYYQKKRGKIGMKPQRPSHHYYYYYSYQQKNDDVIILTEVTHTSISSLLHTSMPYFLKIQSKEKKMRSGFGNRSSFLLRFLHLHAAIT